MIRIAKIGFVLLAVSMASVVASAQERVSLRPGLKAGQQDRYSLTATVETGVTPSGSNGLASNSRRELTATILINTVSVSENYEINQEAIIESISLRSVVNGTEQAMNVSELVKKQIGLTLSPAGHLLKCTIPQPAERLGLVEALSGLLRWLPEGDVIVGQTWKAFGQGPFQSDALSEIPKGATIVYKLASVANGTAVIEGAITLKQSGTGILTSKDGPLNVTVIAGGKGAARFDFDHKAGRMAGGSAETRIEGRVAYALPVLPGEKLQFREGSLVETSKVSIKLIQ